MTDIAIRVDNLSKQYRLGKRRGYKTFRETIQGLVRVPLARKSSPRADQTFWALKDVSFEVKQGEVVGIIGRNGAGKSTLLKVLSRITDPSSGQVETTGRVGSLLEVGTGFHPELTGRENVYLNGAILGMRRTEIARKFDEIVAFAETEKFLDTPVKFYSSGMYMRLAFAVAAHLEPEILIVDEVLAVGDAEFQRKCIGKMGDIAGHGRTVLFVSHNMQAIAQLTRNVIVLRKGSIFFQGQTAQGINAYLTDGATGREGDGTYNAAVSAETSANNHIVAARAVTSMPSGLHDWGRAIDFEFHLKVLRPARSLCFSFQVVNSLGQAVCHFWLFNQSEKLRDAGEYRLQCKIEKLRLFGGRYSLTTWLSDRQSGELMENLIGICPFEVTMDSTPREQYPFQKGDCMYIEDCSWTVER